MTTCQAGAAFRETIKLQMLLKCGLSDEEVMAAGDRMAQGLEDIERLEDRKKAVMDDIKARISGAAAQVAINRDLVRNRYEFRDVDCERVVDYKDKTVTTARMDTGEIVGVMAHEE